MKKVFKISEIEEITPRDKETIKYLSNVIDNKTGKISQPFTIDNKKYQMVRGVKPDKSVIMGVYCFDDFYDNGDNMIHEIDYFEENIAKSLKEKMAAPMGADIQPLPPKKTSNESLNLSEFKHFVVNKNTGKFKKFKTNEELAKNIMEESETYMTMKEFKKFFDEKIFGKKRKITKNQLEENFFRL